MLTLEYFANHHKKEEDFVNFDAFLPLWAGKFTSNTWGAWVCTQTKQALGKYIQVKRTDEKFVKSLGGMSNAMGIRSPPALGVFEDVESLVQVYLYLITTFHHIWPQIQENEYSEYVNNFKVTRDLHKSLVILYGEAHFQNIFNFIKRLHLDLFSTL